jgi:hypothetical protein
MTASGTRGAWIGGEQQLATHWADDLETRRDPQDSQDLWT